MVIIEHKAEQDFAFGPVAKSSTTTSIATIASKQRPAVELAGLTSIVV